jgi:LysM repeat protein
MSQILVFLLLVCALVLPVLGAAMLRLLAPRLDARQFFGGAGLLFAIAIVSVLVLSRSNIESLRIGNLTLLLPLTNSSTDDLNLPPEIQDLLQQTPVLTDTVQPDLEASPTASIAITASATLVPTTELTPTGTVVPTATITPTVELPPTATITPTVELPPTATPAPPPPPEPTAAPPQPRTYTVQPGDTLRSIAAQFNVSVADIIRVNNLTNEQADNLRVGTVLTIP